MFFLYDAKDRELLAPSSGWLPIREQIDNTICASGFSLNIVPRRSEVPSNLQVIIMEKHTGPMDANHWSAPMSNQPDNFYFDHTEYSGRTQVANNQLLFEKALAANQTAAYKLFASLYARLRLGESSINLKYDELPACDNDYHNFETMKSITLPSGSRTLPASGKTFRKHLAPPYACITQLSE